MQLFVAVLLMLAPEAASTTEVREAEVCDVAINPQNYDGQTVLLRGQLSSDFHHASLITGSACSDSGIFLGRSVERPIGAQEFHDAWWVSRSCPQDTLYFSVQGRIELQHLWHRDRWVIAATEFSELKRADGSSCPLTMQDFFDQRERGE